MSSSGTAAIAAVTIDPAEVERIIEREKASWAETVASRKLQRALNLDPTSKRLTAAKLKELKSDMKRTTTLLRRLKELKEKDKDSALAELDALNLSKFVTESAQNIVASVLEGKTKAVDVPSLVAVCAALHQKYDNFMVDLLTEVRKKWVLTDMMEPKDETHDASRCRTMTKFTCELFLVGIITEWKLFRWIVTQIATAYGNARDPTIIITALSVINILAKSLGPHTYGAGPWPPEEPTPLNVALAKVQHSEESFVSAAATTEMRKCMLDFAKSSSMVLKASVDEMEDLFKQNMDAIQATGELPETLKESFGSKKKVCDKLYAMLSPFVFSHPDHDQVPLVQVPTLAKLQATLHSPQQSSNSIVFLSGLASFYTVGDIAWSSETLYDSDEQKAFYEEFDELTIPFEEALAEYHESKDSDAAAVTASTPEEDEAIIEQQLSKLYRECTKKNLAQSIHIWATTFFDSKHALCRYRTKGSKDLGKSFLLSCKRKLLKFMREVPPARVECIPGLCRLAALVHQTGDPSICDLGELFGKSVEEDLFKILLQEPTHGPHELKVKLKLALMLCENVKFRTIQTGGILRMLGTCCEEGHMKRTPHVLEVLTNMLESVGTFLMRNAMTRLKFEANLTTLAKNIRIIGGEYELRLGTAIATCREALSKSEATVIAQTPLRVSKDSQRIPQERYLRHLLFNELSKYTLKTVVAQIFKFNWADPATRVMIIRNLRKAYRVNYAQLGPFASVLKQVSERYDAVGMHTVDDIMERCRQDLEQRDPAQRRTQQKRLVDIELFAELFILDVVHESTLFYVLYMLAHYRKSSDQGRDYSRIRLLCALLQGCATMLHQESFRKRLQYFLFHFYILVHTKQRPYPVDVNFAIGDAMDLIQSYYPKYSGIDKFPDTPADADRMFSKHMNRLQRSRGRPDPVNDYYSYFTNHASFSLHPVVGQTQEFYGFEHDEGFIDIAEEELSVLGLNSAAAPYVETQQPSSKPAARVTKQAISQAAKEEEEFDKMLKDMTKESYDSVKQASSLKSLSARKSQMNIGAQMMQLQSVLRTPEYASTLGTVSRDGTAVSIGIAVRNKEVGRSSGKVSAAGSAAPCVLVRKVEIPTDCPITQVQRHHIMQSRMDAESVRRGTQTRVREMLKEDAMSESTN